MDELFGLLPVLLIYLVAALADGKRKKRRKRERRKGRSPMRSAAQGEQWDIRKEARTEQTARGFSDAFGHEAQSECAAQRIHLHEVSQAQFAKAMEGEDPCHAGGEELNSVLGSEPECGLEAESPLAQDVLRGVIMSEILARPQERAAMQRNRRGYHGT